MTRISDLEERTVQIGHSLFRQIGEQTKVDAGQWLQQQAMRGGMNDERVKTQLFRFVDALPALDQSKSIARHLQEYLDPVREGLPSLAAGAIHWLPRGGPIAEAVAGAARWGARAMARQFIAASDLPGALRAVRSLRSRSLAFTIDLLGEAVLSEPEADRYASEYLRLISGLCDDAAHWPASDLLDRAPDGSAVPAVNVSIKLSSLYSQFDPLDSRGTTRAVRKRLERILHLARTRGAFVNFDMEQYAFKDLTLAIVEEVLGESSFRNWADVGIAIQAYLRDSQQDLQRLLSFVERRGTPLWVRLVKGAYWDYETVIAAQNLWPSPVFDRKPQTDANFEALTAFLVEHRESLKPAIASHNVRSIAHALALAEEAGLPRRSIEFQMLYGMANPIKSALAAEGERVRVYTPFGELLPGMAYLVRRLLENTSNESFLRAGFLEHAPKEQLLMNPASVSASPVRSNGSQVNGRFVAQAAPFTNEALSDFSRPGPRQQMEQALRVVQEQLGRHYALVIGGARRERQPTLDSVNPSHANQIVGRVSSATADDARDAVAAAVAAFPGWRDADAEHRCRLLERAAQIIKRRRFELSAWQVIETGKPAREADADVAEAIDYCNFYAAEMRRLAVPQRRDVPGEQNATMYEGLGVAVVIAPWNFPLAILCGMTSAALVAGNTVVMKPAEQSAVVGAKLMEVFEEAGFPPGVVNFLPGVGEEVGPVLVEHPLVSIIAFTGSRAVGLQIQASAARTVGPQDHVKRVITEMGGKNAIIVDDDADLDDAVRGVVASAFGYAGQKCSACSRAIVLDGVYDQFLRRLVEATQSLKLAPAEDPACAIGPVIDRDAQQRIQSLLASVSARDGKMVLGGDIGELATEGFYVAPHIFADVRQDSKLAQDEIFGPVLAVLRARDLDEAFAIFNSTQYALTGGLYSRSPAHLDRARRELRVGNLYLNRKITGALVDRQPFGGFKLSGGGTKAGGADYLLNFLLPRTITENTLRHGFAPVAGE